MSHLFVIYLFVVTKKHLLTITYLPIYLSFVDTIIN